MLHLGLLVQDTSGLEETGSTRVAGRPCRVLEGEGSAGSQFTCRRRYCVDEETGPLPIEVKAGGNTAGGSIASFVKNYDLDRAVRFTLLGWERQDWLLNVPLYAANGYISSLARA